MLLNNTDEFAQYYDVNSEMNWSTIQKYVQKAEKRYIIPVISQGLYDYLDTTADGDLSSIEKALKELVLYALAHYSARLGLPFWNTNVGDAGVQQNISANSERSTREAFNQRMYQTSQEAYYYTDEMLLFLEENKSSFPDWANSDSYTINRELFIANSVELTKEVSKIHNSRQAYMKLRSYIVDAERIAIVPYISKDLYDEMKAQLLAGTLNAGDNPDNYELLLKIRPAIAQATMTMGLIDLTIDIDGNGQLIFPNFETISVKNAEINKEKLERMLHFHEKRKKWHLAEIKEFLDYSDANKYPLYKSSGIYTEPTTDPVDRFDEINSKPNSGIFAV